MKREMSKLCSGLDDHFAMITSNVMSLLQKYLRESDTIFLCGVQQLIILIIMESIMIIKNNPIKIVYFSVLVNILNQEFHLILDIFCSVLIRKFYFLVPSEKPFPSNQSLTEKIKFYSDLNIHSIDSQTFVSEEDLQKFLISKFEKYEEMLKCYSLLYFSLIGFHDGWEYEPLRQQQKYTIPTRYPISGANTMIKFFEVLESKKISNPLLGIILKNAIHNCSDILRHSQSLSKKLVESLKTLKGKL